MNSPHPIRYVRELTPHQKTKVRPTPAFIPHGKVLIVRGRTQTQVYHKSVTCQSLRGVSRPVKLGYALSVGLRPCIRCSGPQQLTLDASNLSPIQVLA